MFPPGSYKTVIDDISIDEISMVNIKIVRIQIDVKSTNL